MKVQSALSSHHHPCSTTTIVPATSTSSLHSSATAVVFVQRHHVLHRYQGIHPPQPNFDDSGAILCQLSALKDMLDQVNDEIEANFQITREIESEIVKCSEFERALASSESELMKTDGLIFYPDMVITGPTIDKEKCDWDSQGSTTVDYKDQKIPLWRIFRQLFKMDNQEEQICKVHLHVNFCLHKKSVTTKSGTVAQKKCQ
uniref:Uncharacterized protein n=1 Tax=Lactuca sativa TaxID=4236 RepID=A0A9R1UD13_LACSA|nr:hypothetical protein LSAT_V11C900484100 [Lactuca sativa]